jgi:hypothetical protein
MHSLSIVALIVASACGVALAAQEPEWPVEIESDGAKIVLYQPQPESFQNDKLSARAAVSVQRPGEAEPTFGAIWIESRVETDRDQRTATVLDITVPKVKFPNATPEQEAQLAKVLQTEVPKHTHTFSLDMLLTTLDDAEKRKTAVAGLETAPPKIVFATVPTVLVTLDGAPQMQPIEGSNILRVINTPFVVLFDPSSKLYEIKSGDRWVKAPDLAGPWQDDPDPPKSVTSAVPPSQVQAGSAAPVPQDIKSPRIVVAFEPTELIVSDGEPKWTPIEGNDLLYLANSDSDVFMEVATQQYFALLAGRWYHSASLDKGPWTYVPADRLPAPFAKIPPTSERANVRAFVAGTDEARDAVLDASIPQTTVVNRATATCNPTYDGKPQFEPIKNTPMYYAANTNESVIAYEGAYYCCHEGVWFTSTAPTGPWTVCTVVPPAIYTIPPSSPLYPVTYVYVYDSTPDVVYCGYLPGYTGCYVFGPTIVWGTGWYYPCWVGHACYPHPWTWGFCAHYNPWTAGWSFGASFGWGIHPGWFGLSVGWGHPGWWGVGGFTCNHFDIHGRAVVIHPPVPSEHVPRFHFNAVQTHVGHDNIYLRAENRARVAAGHLSGPGARMKVAGGTPNNVFADRDGHVVRYSNNGWQEHRADGWKPFERARPSDSAPREAPRPPATPPGEGARPPPPGEGARPGAPPQHEAERPFNSPPRAAPRDDFERMIRARQQGSARASGFMQRANPAPRGGGGGRKRE